MLSGCGYIGEPLPPLANVPAKIGDLSAVQRGSRIIVQFTVPQITTETKPIPGPIKLDLRAGTAERFDEASWSADAKKIPAAPIANGIARYEFPANDWTGKFLIIGGRVEASNGKTGAWSNFVVLPVVAPPPMPANMKAIATAEGVKLTWAAQSTLATQFRVFRKPEGVTDFALAATVDKPEWTDAEIEYGKQYTYLAQTVMKVDDNKLAESDLSAETAIKPIDTFPPAPPTSLHVTAGPASNELSWDPNTESDLASYRVYRAASGGQLEKLADVAPVPAYSDKAIQKGVEYRYAVTALDRAGNESQKSPPATAQ
jgi:hypothetical protein